MCKPDVKNLTYTVGGEVSSILATAPEDAIEEQTCAPLSKAEGEKTASSSSSDSLLGMRTKLLLSWDTALIEGTPCALESRLVMHHPSR